VDVDIYILYLVNVKSYFQIIIIITDQNFNISFSDGLQYNLYCYNDTLILKEKKIIIVLDISSPNFFNAHNMAIISSFTQ